MARTKDASKKALQAAGTAATVSAPFVARAAMPLAQAALSRAIPNNLLPAVEGAISQLPPEQTQHIPLQTPPVNPQPPMAAQPNIPQPAQPAQAQAISIDPSQVLDKLHSKTKVDELAKNGNTAETITAYFQKFHPDIVKKAEKESGKDFENVVSEYLVNRPKEDEIIPEIQPETKKEALPGESTVDVQKRLKINYGDAANLVAKRDSENEPKIEKHSTVATPNGVGEVLEIRNGQAIVEVDGKKHKVTEDELISSPIPEKDLADLYDDLISGIEKTTGQEVSKNVNWAGYDPKVNELAYMPHGSNKLYVYEDISPEDAEILTNLLTKRKTTGENFVGPWVEGTTSPIGAAMHKLIMKLQAERGGKGNEYKNRFESIYDALEPAVLAKKRKHAERKKKAKKPRTD